MIDNLGCIMQDAVDSRSGETALIECAEDGGGQPVAALTYRELDARLDQIASAAAKRWRPGDRVAVILRNRIEFPLAVFGLMRAGIVPAPLNPRLSAEELAFLLSDLDPVAIVADETSFDAADTAARTTGTAERFVIGEARGEWHAFRSLSSDTPPARFRASAADPALILYTSGSTGRPKGVILPHQGQIRHFLDQRRFYAGVYSRPPRMLLVAPLFHKNGTGSFKTSFSLGGTAVILPRFHPAAALRAIAAHDITAFLGVSTMYDLMLRERELTLSPALPHLESLQVGSAPTGRVFLDHVEASFGVRTLHMYGSTEAGAVLAHDPKRRYTLDSCGKPMPGVEAKLLDEAGREGAEGELWVRSPGLAAAYRNRDAETTSRFQNGWYRTGDILKRDAEGYYFFRGRVDDMFVCGGENVYPMEVERVLLLHPGVRGACVTPINHPTKGAAPVAMVASADPALCEADLKAWFLQNGPAYAHPRRIVMTDTLPVAATGKMDRAAVKARLDVMLARWE